MKNGTGLSECMGEAHGLGQCMQEAQALAQKRYGYSAQVAKRAIVGD